jgi:hypothetical protein
VAENPRGLSSKPPGTRFAGAAHFHPHDTCDPGGAVTFWKQFQPSRRSLETIGRFARRCIGQFRDMEMPCHAIASHSPQFDRRPRRRVCSSVSECCMHKFCCLARNQTTALGGTWGSGRSKLQGIAERQFELDVRGPYLTLPVHPKYRCGHGTGSLASRCPVHALPALQNVAR